MAVQRYKKPNRRKKALANVIIWAVILAIFAGAAVIFIVNYQQDTTENLQKVNYPQKYSEYVDKAAKDYNLDPALIYAVIRTESGFDP